MSICQFQRLLCYKNEIISHNIRAEALRFSQQYKIHCDPAQIPQGVDGVENLLKDNVSIAPAECTDKLPLNDPCY